MEISKDCVVTIEYTVQLEDGSYIKGSPDAPASMNFTIGYDQVLPSLEARLYGLKEGEEVSFKIDYIEAFGPYKKELLKRRSFEEFPEGKSLIPGKWVVATNPVTKAQYSYKVIEKTDSDVLLDFNHPLAGKDLFYKVKIVKVRPATEEELSFLRPCEFGKEKGTTQ
ncbi:MAG: FKBP-type peptidyl-prolyl cis-trans isomerase [Thermodesulforhabdaceae bacterium]|jgi:FKBP-type peptidyl-prolyl cis-trans isomerase SlyD